MPHGLWFVQLLLLGAYDLVLAVPGIFYLRTLQQTLERCAEQSRTTSPRSVWLMFVPLFNVVWHFILVDRIAASLRREFARRNILGPDMRFDKGLGVAMGALGIATIVPGIGSLLGIPFAVCWIVYWVRISGYSDRIAVPADPVAAAAG